MSSRKVPRFALGKFISLSAGYWLLFYIVWSIIFGDWGETWETIGTAVSLVLGTGTSIAQLYNKQKQYIADAYQETFRLANDIDLTRQHLRGLKRDYLPEQKEQQMGLVTQMHRYDDQLTQTKMDFNQAVADYNKAIQLQPYKLLAHPKELDYYSDFYV